MEQERIREPITAIKKSKRQEKQKQVIYKTTSKLTYDQTQCLSFFKTKLKKKVGLASD